MCDHYILDEDGNWDKTKISGCAEWCPTGATLFGSVEELLAEAKRRVELQEGTEYNYPIHSINSGDSSPKKVAKYINYIYGETEGGGTQYMLLSAVPFEKLGLPVMPKESMASKSEGLQHTIYKGVIAPVVLFGGLVFAAYRSTNNEVEGGADE